MATFLQDLAYSARLAWRRPALTIVTILTLALGIGGNSAIFSLVNGLFLRPLPADRPEQLVRIFGIEDGQRFNVASYPNLSDLAARSQTFQSTAIHQQTTSAFGLGDATETADIELVSGSYFSMFGVNAAMGRMLGAADDAEGKPETVAVISDAWWRTRLGSRADVVGRTIHLNGTPFTVVGVAPPPFRGSYDALATDLWVPLMAYDVVRPRGIKITTRGWGWLSATARLKPGVTIEQAQADVDRVVTSITRDFPRNTEGLAFHLTPASALPEQMLGTARRVLLFALLAAALGLAAACANVANVQLATVFDRRREIAVRIAMGASRARIARQWLTESLVVSLAAVVVGTIGGMWLQAAAATIGPPAGLSNFSPADGFDIRLVMFSAAIVFAITALFGGLPAVRAARVDVASPLKEDTVTSTPAARRAWAQAVLVAAQVAVSVALVMSGAMLARSLSASRAFDVGFDTGNLMIATPTMSNVGFDADRGRAYYADTVARIRALPGVKEVALGALVPLGLGGESSGYRIEGYSPPDGKVFVSIANNFVSTNYFEVMRIPIRRGRGFTDADGLSTAPVVAVVNETMARTYWPDQNPIGHLVRRGDDAPIEIVGIVADITYQTPGEAPRPFIYLPSGPVYFPYGLAFHVRTDRADAGLSRALVRELRAFDPRVQAVALPYEELRAQSLYPGRTLAAISGLFGAIAVLLAMVGIYGVMAHVVAARRREFAVRLALGARPAALMRSVVMQGLRWTTAGIVAGTVLAVSLSQLLTAFLFDVSPSDAVSMAAAALTLIVVAVVAAYAPARRVVKIDPATTLRS
jgi:predicted permease